MNEPGSEPNATHSPHFGRLAAVLIWECDHCWHCGAVEAVVDTHGDERFMSSIYDEHAASDVDCSEFGTWVFIGCFEGDELTCSMHDQLRGEDVFNDFDEAWRSEIRERLEGS